MNVLSSPLGGRYLLTVIFVPIAIITLIYYQASTHLYIYALMKKQLTLIVVMIIIII